MAAELPARTARQTGRVNMERRRRATQQSFYRRLDGVEMDGGIWASVTPASPDRSLLNGVTFDDPGAVERALPKLFALYEQAGVRAWCVWVAPSDRALIPALAEAGHVLDAVPEAMGAPLDAVDLDGPELGEPAPPEEIVAINEAAYGLAPGSFEPLGGLDLEGFTVPGRAVVCLHEHDGDAGITLVATHPGAQRQGLATALMKQALRQAQARGCTTTTLEASPPGRPVYERMGYQALGTIEMWEHRVPAS
jgi:GNAT superfamily N-acetyltransferase